MTTTHYNLFNYKMKVFRNYIFAPLTFIAIFFNPTLGSTEEIYTNTQKNDSHTLFNKEIQSTRSLNNGYIKTNGKANNNDRQICQNSTKSFLSELAAENGVYLEKAKCSFNEISDMAFVYFDMPNRYDSWIIVATFNPTKYQFINSSNQYIMCLQKRNGDFQNVGKRCT